MRHSSPTNIMVLCWWQLLKMETKTYSTCVCHCRRRNKGSNNMVLHHRQRHNHFVSIAISECWLGRIWAFFNLLHKTYCLQLQQKVQKCWVKAITNWHWYVFYLLIFMDVNLRLTKSFNFLKFLSQLTRWNNQLLWQNCRQ